MVCSHLLVRQAVPIPGRKEVLVRWICAVQGCSYVTAFRTRSLVIQGLRRHGLSPACCVFCGQLIYTILRISRHECVEKRRFIECVEVR